MIKILNKTLILIKKMFKRKKIYFLQKITKKNLITNYIENF
jgi:hypothetical protein